MFPGSFYVTTTTQDSVFENCSVKQSVHTPILQFVLIFFKFTVALIPHPASCIPHPASRIPHPASLMPLPNVGPSNSSNVWFVFCAVCLQSRHSLKDLPDAHGARIESTRLRKWLAPDPSGTKDASVAKPVAKSWTAQPVTRTTVSGDIIQIARAVMHQVFAFQWSLICFYWFR